MFRNNCTKFLWPIIFRTKVYVLAFIRSLSWQKVRNVSLWGPSLTMRKLYTQTKVESSSNNGDNDDKKIYRRKWWWSWYDDDDAHDSFLNWQSSRLGPMRIMLMPSYLTHTFLNQTWLTPFTQPCLTKPFKKVNSYLLQDLC